MTDFFSFRDRQLALDQTHVMGILNVTPDSFSDGGQFLRKEQALQQAQVMVNDGAAIIDIGGESTRPGAAPVSLAEEMDRVLPVVEALARQVDVVISVDTSSPELMLEAASLGAHLINDVRALQRDGAVQAVVRSGIPACLMHMQGQPETMQDNPDYDNVITDVQRFFKRRIEQCVAMGLDSSSLLLDPGFGFGKTIEHNLILLNRLPETALEGLPLLVGMSRKSMIDHVLQRPVDRRLSASIALASAATLKGAFIVRVHDVAESVDAVRMMNAVKHERNIYGNQE